MYEPGSPGGWTRSPYVGGSTQPTTPAPNNLNYGQTNSILCFSDSAGHIITELKEQLDTSLGDVVHVQNMTNHLEM